MLHQIAMGKSVDNGVLSLHDAFEKVENNDSPPPIFPDAVLFLDENHTVASLGGSGHDASCSRRQYFVSVDKNTGALKKKTEGGVMPKRRYRIVAKYTKEARGCYGVCCPVVGGTEKPQFMETWDYTEKKLVSLKAWNALAKTEMTYRRGMKQKGWTGFNGENPYQERYGDTWETELANSPSMKRFRYENTYYDTTKVV
jgi:hypothetical protein